jgi:hypothetical protein
MFKLNFLRLRTNSLLKRNKSIRASIPYAQSKSIGVIFTVEDRKKHEEIKEFVKHLEQDGKMVRVLEFLPKEKENYDFLYSFFTLKHLNFWGNITSSEAIQFADQPFDYLFHLDTASTPLFEHLLARTKAHCRIGKFRENEDAFYELMIDCKGSFKELLDSIYKYTKELR